MAGFERSLQMEDVLRAHVLGTELEERFDVRADRPLADDVAAGVCHLDNAEAREERPEEEDRSADWRAEFCGDRLTLELLRADTHRTFFKACLSPEEVENVEFSRSSVRQGKI